MVKLRELHLEGFKGHSSLDISFSNITLITGRNNSGKTSVLEAVDMLFNPRSIRRFEDNVTKLINVKHEKGTLKCKFSGVGGQTRLSEYSEEGVDERALTLERARESKVQDYIIETLLEQINRVAPSDSMIGDVESRVLFPPGERKELERVTELEASELLDEDRLADFSSNCVIMEFGGSRYPYLYMGEKYEDLIDELATRVGNELAQNFNEQQDENRAFYINQLFRRAIYGRHGRSVFLQSPPSLGNVKFPKEIDLRPDSIRDTPGFATTIQEIEEYINKNNLMENVSDFNLDNVVFEENGGKYEIPYQFMGRGLRYVVGFLWEMKRRDREKDVILLEEPENHMHPGYIRQLVKFLTNVSRRENIQLVMTTHSIDFISGFFNVGDASMTEYLTDNFKLVQLSSDLPQILDYERAKQDQEELQLDLRGL